MHPSLRLAACAPRRAATSVAALPLLLLLLFGASGGCLAEDRRQPTSIEFRDGPCSDPSSGGSGGGGAAGDVPARRPRPTPPSFALAVTDDARLAVVDVAGGTTVTSVSLPDGVVVRDLDFDGVSGRALVFESDADDQGGEVTAYPILEQAGPAATSQWVFGPRQHIGWVDGRARLLAQPSAVLLFEEAYGTRWRLLDGAPSTSLIAPRPASVWRAPDGASAVQALLYGPPPAPGTPATLLLASAPLAMPLGPLDVEATLLSAGSDPPSARAVPAPALGGVVLADVVDGMAVVRLWRDGEATEAEAVDELGPVARVEAAVALHGGRTVAVLASGPARLGVVRLGQGGGLLSQAAIDLAGDVRIEDAFFSRDLAAAGDERLLVATSAGVVAVVVSVDGGVSVDVDAAFAGAQLRGPLAAIVGP